MKPPPHLPFAQSPVRMIRPALPIKEEKESNVKTLPKRIKKKKPLPHYLSLKARFV